MKSRNLLYIFIAVFLSFQLLPSMVFTQDYELNVEVGKKYRFVFFDDNEITGTVISIEKSNIKIKTDNGEIINVLKENILYTSNDFTPQKYKYSVSLLGGVSLLAEDYYSHGYYTTTRDNMAGYHGDLTGMFYLSDSKAIKIDFGFSKFNRKNESYSIYYSEYPSYYSGGDVTYFSFKPSMVLGAFKPKERFFIYGSLGVGINYTNEAERTEKYYSSYDSAYRTYNTPSRSYVNALFGIGGGIGFRIGKNLGIHAEAEYNMITYDGTFLIFFGGRGYFPLRIGLTYMLY